MNAGVACGCREREKALEYDPDSGDAIAHQTLGKESQQRWRCPQAGYTPAAKASELDGDCQRSIEGVGNVTGFKTATTCPMSYVEHGWVVRAARAQFYRDKGQLALIEPTPISAAMTQALQVLDQQRDVRARRDLDKLKSKTETPSGSD